MAASKITNTSPDWYEAGERASGAEIKALVESVDDFEETWSDIEPSADWRWCDIPRAALAPMLYKDRKQFIHEHIKDEDEDCAMDTANFDGVVADMRAIGVTASFEREPAVIYITPTRGDRAIEVLSDEYPIGAAFHEFGASSIRALVAIAGANRFLPRERAEPWTDDPGWSAHALDSIGPRFEDDLSLRGGACKTAFAEIVGDIDDPCSAAQVERFLAEALEWSGDGRDAWLDQEPEFPAVRSPRRIEAMDAAANKVIAFLKRCAEIGAGMIAGPAAAKFKPPRRSAA